MIYLRFVADLWGCSSTAEHDASNVGMWVQFPSSLLMDTLEQIYEMAEETYPDDEDLQEQFIEGAILALHYITVAELRKDMANGES
jgi:uncharacterized protein YceK